jgi:hypothetical protein
MFSIDLPFWLLVSTRNNLCLALQARGFDAYMGKKLRQKVKANFTKAN